MTDNPTTLKAPPALSTKVSVGLLAKNMFSLLGSDVVDRLTSFVIYMLVGRYLGPYQFGQISLALSMFYLFQVFAVAGLKTLVTREVTKDLSRTDRYLVNGTLMIVFTSVLSYLGMLVYVTLKGAVLTAPFIELSDTLFGSAFAPYRALYIGYPDTRLVISLVCLGLFPFALASMCEAVFLAWERMTFIVSVTGPVNLIRIAFIFLVVTQGWGLYAVAFVLFISYLGILLFDWYFILRYITRPKLKPDFSFGLSLLRKSSTFLGVDAVIALMSSMQVLLLSSLLTQREVGLYSSAIQLVTPLQIGYRAIVMSVFPLMCRRFDVGSFEGLREIANRLIEMIMFIAIPLTVGITFMAEWGLVFLYADPEFAQAGGAVRIVVWVVLLRVFTSVLGQVLVAGLKEKVTLRIVIVDVFVAGIAGFILIQRFGMLGAAYASFIVVMVDLIQHYIPVARIFQGIPLARLIWRPLVASLVMGVYVYYVYTLSGMNPWLTILSGALLYGFVLLLLLLLTVGGPRQLRARYLGMNAVGGQ